MPETAVCPREPAMSYSGQPPLSTSNTNSMKSGSQYALAALGLGLVVMGVVMTMWNRVLASPDRRGSKSGLGSAGSSWSVAIVLVCTGVAFLLLSLILGIHKRQHTRGEQHSTDSMHSDAGPGERQADEAERYAVPSYEEVVASDPVGQRSAQNDSTSDLPAYEELMVTTDCGVDFPDEVYMQPAQTLQDANDPRLSFGPIRRNGLPGLELVPSGERHVRSEKMGRMMSSSSPHIAVSSMEPITPPPQYDANPPDLQHAALTSALTLK